MSTKTRDELVDRALQKLLVVGAGQSADSEDQELVDGVVEATIDDLSARDIITITDDDAIEPAVFEWLADCLAQHVAKDFGKQRDPAITQYAESMLKIISSTRPSYEVQTAEHF